jgi:hypothetical protein
MRCRVRTPSRCGPVGAGNVNLTSAEAEGEVELEAACATVAIGIAAAAVVRARKLRRVHMPFTVAAAGRAVLRSRRISISAETEFHPLVERKRRWPEATVGRATAVTGFRTRR